MLLLGLPSSLITRAWSCLRQKVAAVPTPLHSKHHPPPGNLMRANDGRICILDYGLMTEVRVVWRGQGWLRCVQALCTGTTCVSWCQFSPAPFQP